MCFCKKRAGCFGTGDSGSWLYEVVGVGYLFGLLVGKVLLLES